MGLVRLSGRVAGRLAGLVRLSGRCAGQVYVAGQLVCYFAGRLAEQFHLVVACAQVLVTHSLKNISFARRKKSTSKRSLNPTSDVELNGQAVSNFFRPMKY